MILDTQSDTDFNDLIWDKIPRICEVPLVQDAMKKYTSGYLTRNRLKTALLAGTEPHMQLGKTDADAGGHHVNGTITISTSYFKYYKEGHFNYIDRVPITVLHEIGHWGYWIGQRDGHPSDADGRAHNNHDGNLSPLTARLQEIFGILRALSIRSGRLL